MIKSRRVRLRQSGRAGAGELLQAPRLDFEQESPIVCATAKDMDRIHRAGLNSNKISGEYPDLGYIN